MPRFMRRALAILAVLAPLSASAESFPVPAGVNLHNGYIEVINHVEYRDGFSWPGTVRLNERTQGEVMSAHRFNINGCCVVAGTRYVVELNYATSAGHGEPVGVTPRLCNIRGIPFGYAVVVYWGVIKKTREGSGSPTRFESEHFGGRQADTECPH